MIVLTIDHQHEIRDIMSLWLADQGHVGLTAQDANEALSHLKETQVDMVLLAYPLAVPAISWDGVSTRSDADLARAIKKIQPNARLCVMTGSETKQAFAGISMDGYIGKPIQLDMFARVLNEVSSATLNESQ